MLNHKIFLAIEEYVELHLHSIILYQQSEMLDYNIHESELETFIEQNRKPIFKEVLFDFIDKTGLSDSDVYNKAMIDRKLFSKIRTQAAYRPKKNTIMALAFALKLNIKETEELLSSAGYTLSDSDTYDLILQFCIENKIYSIHDVNEALDHFGLKPLVGLT